MTPTASGIAIVVPELEGGGAERVAVMLAHGLAERHRVVVVTYKPGAEATAMQCTHLHLSTRAKGPLRACVLPVKLKRALRKEGCDVALGILTYSNLLLYLTSLIWRHGPRVVASEHTPIASLSRQPDLSTRLQRRLLPWAYRRMPLVVVSQAIADEVTRDRRLSATRVTVVPNPVDIDNIRRLSRARAPITPESDGVGIVCVARLQPPKGLDVLLAAMARLPATHHLTLIGSGPLEPMLRRQVADLDIGDRVTFSGFVANPYPEMLAADLVVLPSRWEGFGLVALEAAALARPFIGTGCDGLREICQALGYPVATPGSVDELADLMMSGHRPIPTEQQLAPYALAKVVTRYEQVLLSTDR